MLQADPGFRKYTKHHNSFTNISANATAMAIIPGKHTLFRTDIYVKDSSNAPVAVSTMKTEIGDIAFHDGAEEIVNDWTAAELLEFEEYLGLTNTAGIIPIYHCLPNLDQKAPGGRLDGEMLAYGTKDRRQLTVTVDVNSGATVTSSIDLRGLVSDELRNRGTFVSYNKHGREFSNAAKQELSNLPMANGNRADLLHIFDNDAISLINLKVAGRDIIENATVAQLEKDAVDRGGRSVVSGRFAVDFMLDNVFRFKDFLNLGINELRYDVTWSSAPNNYEVQIVSLENLNEMLA